VNFKINKGDKIGIIGRNGAGKSTPFKFLSRITESTTGKIHINDRITSLLEVGTSFHPELTCRDKSNQVYFIDFKFLIMKRVVMAIW